MMNARSLGTLLGLAMLGVALGTPVARAADEAKGTFRFGGAAFA